MFVLPKPGDIYIATSNHVAENYIVFRCALTGDYLTIATGLWNILSIDVVDDAEGMNFLPIKKPALCITSISMSSNRRIVCALTPSGLFNLDIYFPGVGECNTWFDAVFKKI